MSARFSSAENRQPLNTKLRGYNTAESNTIFAKLPTWWQRLCLGQCSVHCRWSVHTQLAQQCPECCSCLRVLTTAVESAHIQALTDACKHRQNMPAALLQCLRLQVKLCKHAAEQTAACRLRLPATEPKVPRHQEQHMKGCRRFNMQPQHVEHQAAVMTYILSMACSTMCTA
jgi:hypothetical protein